MEGARYTALEDGDSDDSTPTSTPRPGDGLSPALLHPTERSNRPSRRKLGGVRTTHHPLAAWSDEESESGPGDDENEPLALNSSHQPERSSSSPQDGNGGSLSPPLLAGHKPQSGSSFGSDGKAAAVGMNAINPSSHQYLVQLPDKSFATAVPEQLFTAFTAVREQELEFTQRTGSDAALDASMNELQSIMDDLASSHALLPDNHPRVNGANSTSNNNTTATAGGNNNNPGSGAANGDSQLMFPADLFGFIYHLRRRRSLIFLIFMDTFYQGVLAVLYLSGSTLTGGQPTFIHYLLLVFNICADITALRATIYSSIEGLGVAGLLQIMCLFIDSRFTPILILRFFLCILLLQVRKGTETYRGALDELTRDMPTLFNI